MAPTPHRDNTTPPRTPQRRHCTATTRAGNPCQSQPLRGEDYCSAHHPEAARFTDFKAGVPGPGGGRPRKLKVSELERKLLEERIWPKAKQVILDALEADRTLVARNGDVVGAEPDHAVRTRTYFEFRDRVLGRPRQATELSGPGGGPVELSFADLMRSRVEHDETSEDER